MNAAERIVMKDAFLGVPQLDRGHAYGFVEDGAFVKRSLQGQDVWRLQDAGSAEKPFFLRFGYAFMQDDSGALQVYDADLGHVLWRYEKGAIRSVELRYPRVLVLFENGDVHALQIETGRVLWTQSFPGADALYPLGRRGEWLLRQGSQIKFVQAVTGESREVSVSLPKSSRVLTKWQDGLLLDVTGQYQFLDVDAETLSAVSLQPTVNQSVVHEQYMVRFSEGFEQVSMRHILADRDRYVHRFSESSERVLTQGRYALLLRGKRVLLWDMFVGEQVFESLDLPFPETEPLSAFFVKGGDLTLFFDKIMLIEPDIMKKDE